MKRTLLCMLMFAVAAAALVAQEMLPGNVYYAEKQRIVKMAEAEFEKGEYDKSQEYAAEAEPYTDKAVAYNNILILRYRAETWKLRADRQIYRAVSSGAYTNALAGEHYVQATNYFAEGNAAYASAQSLQTNLTLETDLAPISETMETALIAFSNAYNKAIETYDAAYAAQRLTALIARAKRTHTALVNEKLIAAGDDDDVAIKTMITDAETALADKNYTIGTQKATDAINLADRIRKRDEAENLYNRAAALLAGAREAGIDVANPDQIARVSDAVDKAKTAFETEDYEESITNSQRAISLLEQIGAGGLLPKFYTVRLIPRKRDSFWRISAYDFVYGDGKYWKTLYDKNKNKLRDPNNPDLIHPGQSFEIPSLRGEQRAGTYDPNKKYGSIKATPRQRPGADSMGLPPADIEETLPENK